MSLKTSEYMPKLLPEVRPDVLREIGQLRITAWEHSGGRPFIAPAMGDSWIDGHDQHAHHWIVCDDFGVIRGAARMCMHDAVISLPDSECFVGYESLIEMPAASLNRLVIHPLLRRKNLARAFDLSRVEQASSLGAKSVLVVTHVPSRFDDLQEAGFNDLGYSPFRLVPQDKSKVFLKRLGTR